MGLLELKEGLKNIIYLFIFRERGGRERNMDMREKHQSVASHMCPNQGLATTQRPFALWDKTQPTEPCWLGQKREIEAPREQHHQEAFFYPWASIDKEKCIARP